MQLSDENPFPVLPRSIENSNAIVITTERPDNTTVHIKSFLAPLGTMPQDSRVIMALKNVNEVKNEVEKQK
jgi:hypothetical protein